MSPTVQRPPQPDRRYRVHRSVKCYIADIACGSEGCTWYFERSIERVVYLFPGRVEKVQYKNDYYTLQSPERMKEIVAEQLRRSGAVHIGGKHIASIDDSFAPFPFIDVSSAEDKESYERFQSSPSVGRGVRDA
jgi:hypothetical protein